MKNNINILLLREFNLKLFSLQLKLQTLQMFIKQNVLSFYNISNISSYHSDVRNKDI